MPSGRLGAAALNANTNSLIYTAPAGKSPVVNIRTVNRGADPVTVTLWITAGADQNAASNADVLVASKEIPGYGVMEDTGIVMSAAEKVVARASAATVTVRVHGFED